MSIVDVDEKNSERLDLTGNVSYVRIKADGTIEEENVANAGVFIEDTQVSKLTDSETSEYIRNNFNGLVGIIHRRLSDIGVPNGNSLMFVLGG